MALEEAGELQEAARVFEYAGEHAQAAVLRLEYARTLRDPEERLDGLREGCARNPGTTPEGRRLHLALAEALLEQARGIDSSAKRRALELEAARALEEADQGARAGELYEELGLLRKAAHAYEKSGEISRLEVVLELLERQEQRLAAQRQLEHEVDDAIADGRRRYAYEMLREYVSEAKAHGEPPKPRFVAPLQRLEESLLRRDRVDLAWGSGRVTSIRGGPRFVIGRAPDADLSLPGARLSRHHVELRVDAHEDRPRLVAVDLGSKVGTFVDGMALMPGEPEPIPGPTELGLGMAATLQVHPVTGPQGHVLGAFVQGFDGDRWMLHLPGGGPLALAPDIVVPARILFDRGYVVLDFHSRIKLQLGPRPIGAGSHIELMVADRVTLVDVPLTLEVLA